VQINLKVTSPIIHAIKAIWSSVVLIWLEADSARGLFRSLDNGCTWSFLYDYSMIPKVGCLAADSNGNVYAGTRNGVYVSSNLGVNWIREDSTFQRTVYGIAVSQSGNVFAGTISNGAGMSGDGVYRTTNRGVNWQKMSNGISHSDILSVCVLESGSILAATTTGVLFRTSNGGQHWTEISRDTFIDHMTQDTRGQIWLAVRTKGLCRSTDDGTTWATTNLKSSTTAFVVDKFGNLYAGVSRRGIMKSSDGGDSWIEVNRGLMATSATTLHIDRRGNVWAGTTSGLYRSTNKGATWKKNNLNDFEVPIGAIVTTPKDYILVGTRGKGMFRSSNNGDTWIRLDTTLFNDVNAMATDSIGVVYAISNSGVSRSIVSRSIDNGTSWNGNGQLNVLWPRSLAVGFGNAVFLAADDRVYRSTDQGNGWSRVLSVGGVRQMAADQKGKVFVTTNTHGLGMSLDNGENWSFAQVGELTEAVTVGLEEDVFVSTSSFRSAFSHGVFRSTDKGINWMPFDYGLTNRRVISLTVGNDGKVFAGTSGSGVFRISMSPEPEPEVAVRYLLFQNYPNPFNPTTQIVYQLPQASRVTLKVFDILGREVETLVDREQNAGRYEIAFNASRLASSTYFYRLDAGSFIQTKKMLLIR
jgi:photosystem II stability/assembly factor-like uncharacterized protein